MRLCPNDHENADDAWYCRVCRAALDPPTAAVPTPPPISSKAPPVTLFAVEIRGPHHALVVGPERTGTADLEVWNIGSSPDCYDLEVVGDAALRSSLHPRVLEVAPAGHGDVRLTVEPSTALHGMVNLKLSAHSRGDREVAAAVEVLLQVPPAADLAPPTLEPAVCYGGRSGRAAIVVSNRGDTAVTVHFQVMSQAPGLHVDVPDVMVAGPGDVAKGVVQLRLDDSRDWPQDSYLYRVQVAAPGLPPVEVEGSFVRRSGPKVSRRLLAIVATLVLGLVLVVSVGAYLRSGGDSAGSSDESSGSSTDNTSESSPSCLQNNDGRGSLALNAPDTSEVRALQTALKAAGFQVKVDGDFGEGTQTAVKEFQHANANCVSEQSGVVGEQTWNALPEVR